jgi:hypothetical protein
VQQISKQGKKMNAIKVVAIGLIIAGVLGLVYGNFSYTKDTQQAKLGPLELSIKEEKTINIPIWASIAAIAAGGLMLAFGGTKR